jgi:hypothetical protein
MIGLVINHLLNANAALLALVDTANIYPYVRNPNTALPAIVYTIDSVDPIYDKDEWVDDECTFTVQTGCVDYAILQSIALQVRVALEGKSGTAHSITYQKIYMTGQTEEGFLDGFTNTLTFKIVITGY